MIRQGEVYWLDLGPPSGSGPGFRHPHVVVQNDLFNRSALQTTIVCVITSNPKRARLPGNVQLAAGEAGLPQPSVVNVSQLYTIDKEDLVERIGTLSPDRLAEVLAGLNLVLEPRAAW
ncbi:MAG TPA: type II toxin-antitoxin system PemK/MazF family toxin [Thermoanaerobaculia bacterium]